MRREPLSQRLLLLLAVSVVAGVLVAGMALPVVGGIGLATRSATNAFESLPSDLDTASLPQVSTVTDDKGNPIASFYAQDRTVVPITQIPEQTQLALLSIEDVRFYEHNGVDLKAALRALLRNGSSGTISQGGSTLTQQYVKNVLVDAAKTKKEQQAAISDTLSRKVREAKYALALEHKLSKQQILGRYLNIAYFGDGAYGIGVAARHYFDESVTKLTLPQSALLAGLVQSPDAYDPRLHPVAAKDRRDTVLAQMLKYHFINQATYNTAQATPIKLHIKTQANDCIASKYPYFCDYVKHVFETTKGLSLSMLQRGGLTVKTTIDPTVQKATQEGIHDYVHQHEPTGAASAEAVVEPGTGKVKAIAVSTKYGVKKGENSIDYAVDEKYGGSPNGGFQAGSTFKLFVLAAALKEGLPLSTTINSPSTIVVKDYRNCQGADVGDFSLHNAGDSEAGSFNLRSGTWFSVNTFYAQLEQRVGLCTPIKLAEAMGVRTEQGGSIPQYPSFVLGAASTFSPLDVAGAYATMAAHGKYCEPIVITSITDTSGKHYPVPKAHCQQVVPAGLADTVTSILQGVLTVHGATGVTDRLTGRVAAAKTGTVDDYKGSWFAGYTPQLASAVWVGIPKSSQSSLGYKVIGGRSYGAVFGATIAGKIWQSTFDAALQGKPVEPFSDADEAYTAGTQTTVPNVIGEASSQAVTELQQEGFNPVVSTTTVASSEPVGSVASTSPAPGATAYSGATVTVVVSGGATGGEAPPSTVPSSGASAAAIVSPPATKHHHH